MGTRKLQKKASKQHTIWLVMRGDVRASSPLTQGDANRNAKLWNRNRRLAGQEDLAPYVSVKFTSVPTSEEALRAGLRKALRTLTKDGGYDEFEASVRALLKS